MRPAIATLLVLLSGTTVFLAQTSEKIETINAHKLLSASGRHGTNDMLYYEVCNVSKTPSAFFWSGAGWGVDGARELPVNMCAHRRFYVAGPHKPGPRRISFQGNSGGDPITWVAEGGTLATMRSNLAVFGKGPDGMIEMETITLALTVDEKTKTGQLTVITSDGVDSVLVTFPTSSTSVKELQAILGDSGEIQIDTFGYFRTKVLKASLLLSGMPDHSPAIAIRPQKGRLDRVLKFGDIKKIGDVIAGLSIGKDGRPSTRSDLRRASGDGH
jgi:hypothetical protein